MNQIKSKTLMDALLDREDDLRAWIDEHAPECDDIQAHLDDGSSERAYWHHGYLVAVQDVLALLGRSASTLRH
ncbi:MAG: hypothetical protein QGF16_07235 [Rhodospirillales bacterium]|jgi:uncharacterized protein YecT (DUF1311 family)|nr:hypothetical protein [Rhodospirillales bacterium]|tara:strand:+ start:508 stop:726 length:219 start_codon:yes stop_codon:yes gene_type:complete